jgi:hypothetical protein
MLTDRERLKKAFDVLTSKGYYAKERYWCCSSCALADIPMKYSSKFVFWNEQSDDYAFDYRFKTNDFDDEGDDTWKQYTTIVHPLFLNWSGDAKEIILTLKEFELDVEYDGQDIDHVDPTQTLRILPKHSKIRS